MSFSDLLCKPSTTSRKQLLVGFLERVDNRDAVYLLPVLQILR